MTGGATPVKILRDLSFFIESSAKVDSLALIYISEEKEILLYCRGVDYAVDYCSGHSVMNHRHIQMMAKNQMLFYVVPSTEATSILSTF